MELFGIDAIWIVVLCGIICFGGLFASILFSFLDIIFTIVGAIIELGLELFNAGPVPGCGCLVFVLLLLGCGACGMWYLNAVETCGTADAIILCRYI